MDTAPESYCLNITKTLIQSGELMTQISHEQRVAHSLEVLTGTLRLEPVPPPKVVVVDSANASYENNTLKANAKELEDPEQYAVTHELVHYIRDRRFGITTLISPSDVKGGISGLMGDEAVAELAATVVLNKDKPDLLTSIVGYNVILDQLIATPAQSDHDAITVFYAVAYMYGLTGAIALKEHGFEREGEIMQTRGLVLIEDPAAAFERVLKLIGTTQLTVTIRNKLLHPALDSAVTHFMDNVPIN